MKSSGATKRSGAHTLDPRMPARLSSRGPSRSGFRKLVRARTAAVVILVLLCAGCGGDSKPAAKEPQIGWRRMGAWTGRGNVQSDSFEIASTQWRIKWETTNETPPGAGTFMVRVHSSISGRPLMVAVEPRHGTGKGIALVTEDPRLYHLVIESSAVDWSIQVEEAVVGVPEDPKK